MGSSRGTRQQLSSAALLTAASRPPPAPLPLGGHSGKQFVAGWVYKRPLQCLVRFS